MEWQSDPICSGDQKFVAQLKKVEGKRGFITCNSKTKIIYQKYLILQKLDNVEIH